MPSDATIALQASVTKTATFNGAGLNFPVGTSLLNEVIVRVLYSAASNASGSNTVVFQVDVSPDNSTWSSAQFAAVYQTITLSTTVQSGEIFIPVRFKIPLLWLRLTETLAGAGTSPTITYQGDIVACWP